MNEFSIDTDGLLIDPYAIKTREDYANEDREAYIAEMKSLGFRIVIPKSNHLQIDIDTDAQFIIALAQIERLKKEYPDIRYFIRESRGGYPGRHITVRMPFDMDDMERIAWQAALGSDPLRELLSLFRLKRGDEHPTLFVEKGGNNGD